MKINWDVENKDIQKVKDFVRLHRKNPFVQARIKKNLASAKPRVTKSRFWRGLIVCLVTTQQRSGPNTPVTRFLNGNSFVLNYNTCKAKCQLQPSIREELSRNGLYRSIMIAQEAQENFLRLEANWPEINSQLESLRKSTKSKTERKVADYLRMMFKGLGPKQSRNLLQFLGLTRYEIPIDSRITKWLNVFGFPVELTANALGDLNYYHFVSDGIQSLCRACRIYPCVLDAVIFSSFDDGGWTRENMVY